MISDWQTKWFWFVLKGAVASGIVYVIRKSKADRKGAAILTILADRLIGLYSLFVIAFLASLANLPVLLDSLPSRLLVFSLFLAVVGGPLCIALLFWAVERIPGVRDRLDNLTTADTPPQHWLKTAIDQTALAARLFSRA